MEPAVSMTIYAGVNTAALVLLVLSGYEKSALAVAFVLAAWTMLLEISYWIRRGTEKLPRHRARLDWLVRAQSSGCVVAVVLAATAGAGALDPAPRTRSYIEYLDGALLLAFMAVWLSSLIDWYWILPRLGGLGGPRPCEDTHAGTWNSLTKVWLYHRAIATLLFIGGIAAIPGYLAVKTENDAFAVVMSVITFGVPAVMSEQVSASVKALMNGLNPSAPVGSIVRVRLLAVLTVYIVDASLQGSKYKRLDRPAAFDEKSDGPQIANDVLASSDQSEVVREAESPCAGGVCRRVNWYCRCNENAYSRRG